MYQINNEKFGHFLAEVRKEKQMTQKDLADKLFVSDKTVSKVPKFSLCSDGVLWFKSKSKWQNGGSAPAPGMIIFSDWDYDGISDHVGIVVKCEGGRVYTIEGNSSDQVRQRNYTVDYSSIMGYGVIN